VSGAEGDEAFHLFRTPVENDLAKPGVRAIIRGN